MSTLDTAINSFSDRDYTKSTFHCTNYLFNKSKLAFIHLPKTGGSSLHKLLTKNHYADLFQNICTEGVHRPISKKCPPGLYKYFTISRNPIERVWSYYQMVLRNGAQYPYNYFASKGLEIFLENCWEVRNLGCRYYSGIIGKEPDSKSFNIATKNLKKFLFVIRFNSYEKDLLSFLKSHKIKIDSIPHIRSSQYIEPTKEETDLIYSFNRLDVDLFQDYL